jgi:hypothetical protein
LVAIARKWRFNQHSVYQFMAIKIIIKKALLVEDAQGFDRHRGDYGFDFIGTDDGVHGRRLA